MAKETRSIGEDGTLSDRRIDYVRISMRSATRAFFACRNHLPGRCGIGPLIVFYERYGETDPIAGGNGTWLFRNIDYVRRFPVIGSRVFSPCRIHLPPQFAPNPRSLFYERKGATDPIDVAMALDSLEISFMSEGSWGLRSVDSVIIYRGSSEWTRATQYTDAAAWRDGADRWRELELSVWKYRLRQKVHGGRDSCFLFRA